MNQQQNTFPRNDAPLDQPWSPKRLDGGPSMPNFEKPDTKKLLEKMKRVGRKPAIKQQRQGE